MFSWVLRLEQVDAKQIDDTPNFCKTPVNHFKWRVTFKLYFPPFFFYLEFFLKHFLGGGGGRSLLKLNLKESWAIFYGSILFG